MHQALCIDTHNQLHRDMLAASSRPNIFKQEPLWHFGIFEIVMCNVNQPADIPDALQELPDLRLWIGLSCLVSRDGKGASWKDMIRALWIDFGRSGGTYFPR